MKKTAVKVAILLAVGLFACVLVSRAVTYLTALKGDFVKQQKAYIYKEYTHTGSIEFIDQEDIYWKEALDRPLQITEVHIKTGDYVEKGDSLFTFELYQDAQKEKMALEKELQTLAQSKTALYETILKMRMKLESREVQLAREYVEIQALIPVLKGKMLWRRKLNGNCPPMKKRLKSLYSRKMYRRTPLRISRSIFLWKNGSGRCSLLWAKS